MSVRTTSNQGKDRVEKVLPTSANRPIICSGSLIVPDQLFLSSSCPRNSPSIRLTPRPGLWVYRHLRTSTAKNAPTSNWLSERECKVFSNRKARQNQMGSGIPAKSYRKTQVGCGVSYSISGPACAYLHVFLR